MHFSLHVHVTGCPHQKAFFRDPWWQVADHRDQQAQLRRLLAEESERCAAARAEVLAVSVAAGNERLALHAELAKARRRASSAAANVSQGFQAVRDESEEREVALRKQLSRAEKRIEEQASAHARASAEASQRSAEDATCDFWSRP